MANSFDVQGNMLTCLSFTSIWAKAIEIFGPYLGGTFGYFFIFFQISSFFATVFGRNGVQEVLVFSNTLWIIIRSITTWCYENMND